METATLTTLITAQVRRLLPPEDVPEGDIPDIVRFLTEKYGEPELTPSGSDEEAMVFSLPDRKIKLQRSVSTRALLGFWILAQSPSRPVFSPRWASGPDYRNGLGQCGFSVQSHSRLPRRPCYSSRKPGC